MRGCPRGGAMLGDRRISDQRGAARGLARARHARTRGSLGSPRARSAMMLRWISLVPE